jgi:hypothetical protein
LEDLHAIDSVFHKIGKKRTKTMLRKNDIKIPKGPAKSEDFVLRLICPELSTKKRSKYAHALAYIRENKKSGSKLKTFVRDNGGINGCVEKEKKLRTKPHARRKSSK